MQIRIMGKYDPPFRRFYTQMFPYPFTITSKPFCITSNTKTTYTWHLRCCFIRLQYYIHYMQSQAELPIYASKVSHWFICTYFIQKVMAILIRNIGLYWHKYRPDNICRVYIYIISCYVYIYIINVMMNDGIIVNS